MDAGDDCIGMNLVADIVAFVAEHGTPKLKAMDAAALSAFLRSQLAAGHVVWLPGKALGIGWPCELPDVYQPVLGGSVLYIANLAAVRPGCVYRMLREVLRRWPHTRRYAGHRVPKAQRADPDAPGKLVVYGPGDIARVVYWAS